MLGCQNGMPRAVHRDVLAARPGPTPIRDTADQDRPVARRRFTRRRLVAIAAAAAVIGLGGYGVVRWLDGARSIDADRLRTAEVTRGTLVRDAAVTGRVVAAVSPTLYAPVPGTIVLHIRAGDAVTVGQVLATLESPELPTSSTAALAAGQLIAQLGAPGSPPTSSASAGRARPTRPPRVDRGQPRGRARPGRRSPAKIITELELLRATTRSTARIRIATRGPAPSWRQSAGFTRHRAQPAEQQRLAVMMSAASAS
jgi:HlyD family secretion protein